MATHLTPRTSFDAPSGLGRTATASKWAASQRYDRCCRTGGLRVRAAVVGWRGSIHCRRRGAPPPIRLHSQHRRVADRRAAPAPLPPSLRPLTPPSHRGPARSKPPYQTLQPHPQVRSPSEIPSFLLALMLPRVLILRWVMPGRQGRGKRQREWAGAFSQCTASHTKETLVVCETASRLRDPSVLRGTPQITEPSGPTLFSPRTYYS
jgi:hypothetical protein